MVYKLTVLNIIDIAMCFLLHVFATFFIFENVDYSLLEIFRLI
jgi:hypothetical protein